MRYMTSFAAGLAMVLSACAGSNIGTLTGRAVGPPATSIDAQLTRVIGSHGTGPGRFVSPSAVSVNPMGYVYVADTGNDRVQMLGSEGEYVREIGGFGWDSRQFNAPRGISAASSLDVWVADTQNRRIAHLDSRLNWLGVVDRDVSDGESREIGYPAGVAMSEDGWLWITDRDTDRVRRLSPYGDDADPMSARTSVSNLTDPGGLAIGPGGIVVVADTGADRLVFYDQFGNWLTTWGEGVLSRPEGVAVSRYGDIVVADTGNNRVLLLNRLSRIVGEIGASDFSPTVFREPRGVAVDGRGRLWVADTGNHRILLFTLQRSTD